MFAQHILLSKIVNEGSRQDWGQISLVARDYVPLADSSSELDWAALLDAFGGALSFQEKPQPAAPDPNWLRAPKDQHKTDFPPINHV
jgi:hypothetical protein